MNYTMTYKGATAVCQTVGGELCSYKDANETEYLWCGDPAYWSGHSPVLFPVVGSLIDDTITIDGTAYNMPKHGIIRKREWTLVEQTENSVVMEVSATDESLLQYPFDFTVQVKHTLNDAGFATAYTIINNSDKTMPATIGGHPGFACPLHEGENFSDYELIFDQPETCRPAYTDAKGYLYQDQRLDVLQDNRFALDYSTFDVDLVLFDDLNSRRVTLQNNLTKAGVQFDFYGFAHLGTWTAPGKQAPYICLEPWQGLPAWHDESGAMEDKPNLITLAPQETYTAGYQVTIL